MNCIENLDPGGFAILMHIWTRWGTGLEWLRLLPFTFFLLGVTCLGVLGWRLTRSGVFAIAAAATPMLYPQILYFSFEIRAYSMEMAGIAVCALLLLLAIDHPSWPRLALLGTVCAAFLSSRYSFVFCVAAILAVFTYALWRRGDPLGVTARRLVVFLLPVVAVGLMIVSVTLRRQIWPEMTEGLLGISAPVYAQTAFSRPDADVLATLYVNLLSPIAIPITVAAALFLVLLWRERGQSGDLRAERSDAGPSASLGALYAVVLVVQGLSAAAALFGVHPWKMGDRWSAYLLMVSAVAAVALAADLVLRFRGESSRGTWRVGRVRFAALAGTIAALLVVVMGYWAAESHRQAVESQKRTNLAPQIDALPVAMLANRSVFVAFYEVPTVRYLYEHGPYTGRAEYPRIFRFEDEEELRGGAAIDAAGEGIRFVLSALKIDDARDRFPGAVLQGVDANDSRLLRVVHPSGSATVVEP